MINRQVIIKIIKVSFQGIAIAGYFPGIIVYLSLWYRKQEQIMRITTLSAAAASGIAVYGFIVSLHPFDVEYSHTDDKILDFMYT